jgi:hypothetical protein
MFFFKLILIIKNKNIKKIKRTRTLSLGRILTSNSIKLRLANDDLKSFPQNPEGN